MSSVSTPDYAGTYPYNGKVILAAIILFSVVIFFVILLHIYARWFLGRRPVIAHVVSDPFQTLASLTAGHFSEVTKGLDAKAVASLPVFVSEGGSAGVDCVVCLGVMEEGEVGRVLPRCRHVFHVECVDVWLRSHSTCPICRREVSKEEEEEEEETEEGLAVGDRAEAVVEVGEDELVVMGEELGGENLVFDSILTVELPTGSSTSSQIVMKGDEISTARPALSSLAPLSSMPSSASSCSSSSSSVGCSLKRMVSKSRLESRVFPSALVN